MRSLLFLLFLLCGTVAIATGLLVPAHLRAVDPYVLRQILPGKTLPDLAADVAARDPAVAKLLLRAAEDLSLPNTEIALEAIRQSRLSSSHATILTRLEQEAAGPAVAQEVPVLTALRPEAARRRLSASLESSEARRILQNRDLTNTTIFAPVKSAAGFPLEAAILTTAFLVDRRSFEPKLHDEVLRVSASPQTRTIEEFYLSMLALARRFSSAQLTALVNYFDSIESFDVFTRALQNDPDSVALLYSTVLVSGNGGGVASYLRQFPQTAIADLAFASALGSEPLNRLLTRGEPLFRSAVYDEFATDRRLRKLFEPWLGLAARSPNLALIFKFALIFLGAAFVVVAATRLPCAEQDSTYVTFARFSFFRRASATVVLVMLLMIMGEPYLARGSGEETEQPRAYFSLAALAAPAPAPQTSSLMLDQHTILAIATFLVLQAAIYIICLVKLAEIRKQAVPSTLKLKLLDNEENLFDGGLYCGLFGTAASLILLTLGVIKPSLIAAYSSTLFGILFVALIKIIHVRPYKRRLLLETTQAESA